MKARALFAAALWAAAPLRADAGKDGFAFLKVTGGARQAALGEAGVFLADDVNAAFLNPAVLGALRRDEVALARADQMDAAYTALGWAHPLGKGAAALHAHALSYGDIPAYDAAGGRAGGIDARDLLIAGGYGVPLSANLLAGLAVKRVSESIAGRSVDVMAGDAGFLYRPPSAPYRLSVSYENAGGKARFGQADTALPAAWRAGGSLRLFSNALVLAGGVRTPTAGGQARWGLGQELWLHNALAVRAGWESDAELGNGLRLGIGIRLKSFQVDYAFTGLGETFGSAHRVGLVFRFGGGDRAYQEGLALSQKGRYPEAILKFEEALDVNPGHLEAVRALREAVQALRQEMKGVEGSGK